MLKMTKKQMINPSNGSEKYLIKKQSTTVIYTLKNVEKSEKNVQSVEDFKYNKFYLSLRSFIETKIYCDEYDSVDQQS